MFPNFLSCFSHKKHDLNSKWEVSIMTDGLLFIVDEMRKKQSILTIYWSITTVFTVYCKCKAIGDVSNYIKFLQIMSKSGDCCRARPEPCGFVLGEIRGSNTLLLSIVWLIGSLLRGRKRGETRGGAAATVSGDKERARSWWPIQKWWGEVQQLEGKAPAIWVQRRVIGRECSSSGYTPAGNVPFWRVHVSGGQWGTQTWLERSLLAYCFCMEAQFI